MPASLLIIDDTHSDHYAREVTAHFPEVTVHTALTKERVGEEVTGVDAIWGIGTTRIFSDEMIRKAKRLRWIQAFTTGTDGITGLPSLPREVTVTSMRGVHGPQVAEMALLFMLGLARQFYKVLRNQPDGVWARPPQVRLYGKTVVILGVGIIGQDLATRCKAFGMKVIGVSRGPRELPGFDRMLAFDGLVDAVRETDFLVVITPYSAETHRMVGEKVLAAMKPGAWLVNVARGGVVDEEAVIAALRENRIAGAGLDVFTVEPPPPDSPLWTHPRVMLTPHSAGGSDFPPALSWPILEQNLRCFLQGRTAEMVNLVPHEPNGS